MRTSIGKQVTFIYNGLEIQGIVVNEHFTRGPIKWLSIKDKTGYIFENIKDEDVRYE